MVVIDDSIVRGTTLKRSILRILDRPWPAPHRGRQQRAQIRYPDCYGIDMARMGDFVAFQAAIELHRERGNEALIEQVYLDCKAELEKPLEEQRNRVQPLREPLGRRDRGQDFRAPHTQGHGRGVRIIFQSVEDCTPLFRSTRATGTSPGTSTPGATAWPIGPSSSGKKGATSAPIEPVGLLDSTAVQAALAARRFPPPPASADRLTRRTGRVHGAQPMLGYPSACKRFTGTPVATTAASIASSSQSSRGWNSLESPLRSVLDHVHGGAVGAVAPSSSR